MPIFATSRKGKASIGRVFGVRCSGCYPFEARVLSVSSNLCHTDSPYFEYYMISHSEDNIATSYYTQYAIVSRFYSKCSIVIGDYACRMTY